MHSILAKCQNSKLKSQNLSQTSKLNHPTELSLIRKLIQLPEVVVDISRNHEVHRLPQYATEIADAFHRFYENCQVLSDDAELMAARLGLVKATQIILAEVLSLMGISAPEHM
jgi:arginyl-tRNA synthetase